MSLPGVVGDPLAQQNFDTLRKSASILTSDVGGLTLRVTVLEALLGSLAIKAGNDSMTGSGAALQTKTIAHGLGKTPSSVMVTSGHQTLHAACTARDATNITVAMRDIDNVGWASAQPFYWAVLG